MTSPLWVRYQQALAIVAVSVFFSNAAVFAFDKGLVPVPPGMVVLAFLCLSLPLLAKREVLDALIEAPLVLWATAYIALVGAGFFWSRNDTAALGALKGGVAAGVTLLLFCVALTGVEAQRVAARTVLAVTIVSVLFNAYELFRPGAFGRLPGRSAGLYQNPNISGGAIVLGVVLSYPVLRPASRPLLLLAAGCGVLLTLSRGALATWVATTGALVLTGAVSLSRRQLLVGLILLSAGVAVVPAAERRAAVEAVSLLAGDRLGRLAGASAEVGDATRAKVARDGWELFADRPVAGAGLGATRSWAEVESTHNMYLLFLAELGLIGLVGYLLLPVATVGYAPNSVRPQALGFCTFWLLWGLVSHNLLEDRPLLFGLALMGSFVAAARAAERLRAPPTLSP